MYSGTRTLTRCLTELIANDSNRPAAGPHFLFVVRVAELDNLALSAGLDHALSMVDDLAGELRQHLQAKDTVLRLSDRDLAVVLPNMINSALIPIVCHKINQALSSFSEASFAGIPIRTHIGVAVYPEHGKNPEQIIGGAFTAMVGAARSSADVFQYSEETGAGLRRELDVEKELAKAILNDEFQLAFQPKLDLLSGKLSGAEALLRWSNPVLGVVPPSIFVPIAEASGDVVEMTEWVVQKALNFLNGQFAGDDDFNLSINVSPANLRDPTFPGFLQQCLELWNVDPAFLTLELTEGAMIDDPRQAFAMLTALKELGVRISIDDFGTGYSSLQYLSNLPIDELKIDQSFLRDSSAWESNQKIVKTIVNLAKNFNLEVVAEGVETREILEFLRRIGCHTAQGYFISKPLTEGDFLEFIGKGPAPLSNGLFDNA